jgi:aerobic carbon-monoxide dehydrogenase large subunit
MDLFAPETGLDPAEVRRRNLVPAGAFPHTTPGGAVYDSGDHLAALDKVLAAAGYAGLRAEQARRRERRDPVQLGIGLASYVEITAGDAANGETARLVVHADGTATAYTGTSPHGQGHYTAWAMLIQAELGIPMDQVTAVHGDTGIIPAGVGTYASRSLPLGGVAVHQAAVSVKEQAADLIEASQADMELDTETGAWRAAATRPPAGPGRRWPATPGRRAWWPRSGPRKASPRSRSARMSPWSRWTPRPARPGWSGT